MKIAFLHQPWNRIVHGQPQGSVPIWTSEVTRRLAPEHEVLVYSRRFPDQPTTEPVGGLTYLRIDDPLDPWLVKYVEPLTRLGRRDRSPFSSRLFYPQYYRLAARDMARRGVEIVHVHSFPQAASIIREEHPAAKIVVHLHVEWLNLLPPEVARRQVRDADVIVGCSQYLTEQMQRALPESRSRIKAVFNAVDVEHFSPVRPAVDRPGNVVLFVGRISPEKGIHVLLDAFERVLRSNPHLRLEIIGHDTPVPLHIFDHLADANVVRSLRKYYDRTPWSKLRTWLRSRYPRRLRRLKDTSYGATVRAIAAARMPDHVQFIGFVANQDLPAYYRRAELVVLPSLTETFGMPLVEAMACGVPTVASAAGGIPEIVEPGKTGALVPVFDADALAEAVRSMMNDAEARRRMGEAARARAAAKFSWEATVVSLLGVYRQALGHDRAERRTSATASTTDRAGHSTVTARIRRERTHVPNVFPNGPQ
jgi:glycosyltransferase involved in cell wall biosynthesis